MLQYTEITAKIALRLIYTLRRLELAESPVMTKEDTTEIFNVWKFASKWAK